MNFFRTLVCCLLAAILVSNVIIAKPVKSSEVEITLLRDIDERLMRLEHQRGGEGRRRHHRRGRRSNVPYIISGMNECIRHPRRCIRIMQERTQQQRRRPAVIIVKK